MNETATTYTRSWKPEVFVDGQWASNSLRFRTQDEAERSGRELLSRWFVPTDSRATESTDRPNYRLDESDRPIALCSECELDASPGSGLCAGHLRLETYDPSAEIAANN